MSLLKRGDTGPEVSALQAAIGADVDGNFGPQTEGKLYAFQQAHGLTPDGVAGPLTQAVISSLKNGTHPDNPSQARIWGIDTYRYDEIKSYEDLANAGCKFHSIQIAQGLSPNMVHPHYAQVTESSRAVGIIPGPYFFPYFDEDMKAQANLFCDLVEKLASFKDTDLMPMIDWEYYPESRGVKKGDLEKVLTFGDVVKERLKRKMIIYTGYFTAEEAGENEPSLVSELAQYTLWLAWYARESVIKTPRPFAKWNIWQAAEKPIPGVGGNCDFDWFNGSLNDLHSTIKASIIP